MRSGTSLALPGGLWLLPLLLPLPLEAYCLAVSFVNYSLINCLSSRWLFRLLVLIVDLPFTVVDHVVPVDISGPILDVIY